MLQQRNRLQKTLQQRLMQKMRLRMQIIIQQIASKRSKKLKRMLQRWMQQQVNSQKRKKKKMCKLRKMRQRLMKEAKMNKQKTRLLKQMMKLRHKLTKSNYQRKVCRTRQTQILTSSLQVKKRKRARVLLIISHGGLRLVHLYRSRSSQVRLKIITSSIFPVFTYHAKMAVTKWSYTSMVTQKILD